MCTGSLASNNIPQINSSLSVLNSREIKIHVYGIRPTANVSWEFFRIENNQIKTAKTILMDKTGMKLLIFV